MRVLQKALPPMTVPLQMTVPQVKAQPKMIPQQKMSPVPVLHWTTPRMTLPPLNSRLTRSRRPHLSLRDPPLAVPASVSACLSLPFRSRH